MRIASTLLLLLAVGCAPEELLPTTPEVPPPPAPPVATGKWSDPATWAPSGVPVEGADVEIPVGKTVTLDLSPPTLGRLQINGVLNVSAAQPIELQASGINVVGRLQAGSEQNPFSGRFVITLTGAETPDTPPVGVKALAVYPGGVLELHGQERVSWTRLASTAEVGSNSLLLERPVDWSIGDRIVIASTDFDPAHAEDVSLTGVNGAALTIGKNLAFRHWGIPMIVDGKQVDERAEVGLLSRNITIQSDSFGAKGFGGHVIALAGGVLRVDGVELHRLGQRGRLGRYSMHWHMAGNVAGQYVRNSAIWQTNNRCLTIHGTDNAAASNNVCYDHMGHGYFLEDGAESGNLIERNLGLVARVPDLASRLLASDATPATFWLTNPANSITGNVAAGSVGFGFWFALPAAPTGLSTGEPDRPRLTPLGIFKDNVAHSNKRPGLQVDDGPKADGTTETTSYTPRAGAVSGGTVVTAVFENFVGWKHTGRAIWLRGNSQRVTGAVLADNLIGATFAASTTTLENSFIVGESDNITTSPSANFPIRGYEFYDGTVGASNVVFANFTSRAGRPASAVGYNRANGFPTSTDNFNLGSILRGANAVYLETPSATKDGDKAGIILDLDGSLSGQVGATIVPEVPFLRTSACQQRLEWNAWLCPQRFVGLQIVGESSEPIAPTVLRRSDDVTVRLVGVPNNPMSASMSLLPFLNYAIEPEVPAVAKLKLTLQRTQVNDWIRVSVPFSGGGVTVLRDFGATPLGAVASLAEVDASTGDKYYWDQVNQKIFVKLVVRSGRTSTTVQVQRKP